LQPFVVVALVLNLGSLGWASGAVDFAPRSACFSNQEKAHPYRGPLRTQLAPGSPIPVQGRCSELRASHLVAITRFSRRCFSGLWRAVKFLSYSSFQSSQPLSGILKSPAGPRDPHARPGPLSRAWSPPPRGNYCFCLSDVFSSPLMWCDINLLLQPFHFCSSCFEPRPRGVGVGSRRFCISKRVFPQSQLRLFQTTAAGRHRHTDRQTDTQTHRHTHARTRPRSLVAATSWQAFFPRRCFSSPLAWSAIFFSFQPFRCCSPCFEPRPLEVGVGSRRLCFAKHARPQSNSRLFQTTAAGRRRQTHARARLHTRTHARAHGAWSQPPRSKHFCFLVVAVPRLSRGARLISRSIRMVRFLTIVKF
jgi:hypothetical protein